MSSNDILMMGPPGVVELSGCTICEDAPEDDVKCLASLPLLVGDDAMDVMLGAYSIAENQDLLLSQDPEAFTDVPAIVVGSGPSLDGMIDTLRRTYGQYLIVSSASATRKLLDSGIVPHVIAPKERTPYPDWCFDGLPRSVRYAGLQVVPNDLRRCDQSWCVGSADPLCIWAGSERVRAVGPTSGTVGVSVALDLTTGPVFLTGMDNCAKHHAGFLGGDMRFDEQVACYDGKERDSQWLYRIARLNIQHNSFGRVFQTAPESAIIPGVELRELPAGGSFVVPDIRHDNTERHAAFRDLLRMLPDDWNDFYAITQSAKTLADTQMTRIASRNRLLFQAMLQPTVAQLSMERRLGMSDADVLSWYREATKNMVDMLTDTINQMHQMAGDHV